LACFSTRSIVDLFKIFLASQSNITKAVLSVALKTSIWILYLK